ncbi:MAG: tyrosine-type recombinase/integrase, partial [Thermotogales bacterium]|nr:tyrosine-type recombinase/integrase [Thermotogales bacterium]
MTQTNPSVSPLRQRMIEDMRLRKLSPQTQTAYIRAVKNLTCFLGQSPDTATAEDLRRYQLHLVEQGIASGNLNATITGLTFFFETTLERPEAMKKMRHVYEPRKLPIILSLEEVTRVLQTAGSPKYQAALGVAYGAGLRANEVVHLTTTDIDSERMVIRVEQGKGKRDRYAMLSPT